MSKLIMRRSPPLPFFPPCPTLRKMDPSDVRANGPPAQGLVQVQHADVGEVGHPKGREGGREGGRDGSVKGHFSSFSKVGRYGCQNDGLKEADTIVKTRGRERGREGGRKGER